ncbi:MAG: signal transduction histidine kinase [Planctomycetota bacterium]|nr:signal transduction histidine kinase [Planctomycetota bacterium]
MSYRTFKHLLGETSLERKCRFIFGGGILALVTLSFYWYGQKTESLVIGQKTEAARVRVEQSIENLHLKKVLAATSLDSFVDEFSGEKSPLNPRPKFESYVFKPYPTRNEPRPRDEFETIAVNRFLQIAEKARPSPDGERPTLDDARIIPGRHEYQYVQSIFLKPNCFGCHDHYHEMRRTSTGKSVFAQAGDLAGVVVVKLPMDETTKDIHRNRAILISTALVTAIIAMFASYVIVRYVIVKPVKHLRDVSDAIASGKLNVRSQIQTGDEFEELSHAFNRMLHNLVAMQQELREVNGDLDKKVDELAQANLALFEMNRLKSDFLATMSHELRTPLNSIIGFSEVLSTSESLNERQRRYATNIQSSGKMLLSMINDILDLAKIESGKMEVRVEDFSIRDVCEGLASLARPIAEKKSVDLECRLDEAIPLLHQDSGKLRQILYNLLSNAIKFTPEGGRITLTASPEGRHVILSVRDTGIGIAEEDRERIFEKFRQAIATGQAGGVLTREHQGTGLGLSIVRELTKLLGGDVTLESQLGQGSTFTVRIPMQLAGNRKFDVNLTDERIDLTKARRIEPRVPRAPGALSSIAANASVANFSEASRQATVASRPTVSEPTNGEAH